MVLNKTGERFNDPMFQVASGEFEGLSVLNKFGYNADISTSFEPIWDQGGAYTFLSSATTLTASSSDAADDSVGTGVQTIAVVGLDTNWNEVTQTVIMDGQSGVTLGTDLRRVYRAYSLAAGSGGVNAGDIYVGSGTITSGVPANKYAKISAGNGQTLMSIYTVPSGFRLYMNSIRITAARVANANLDVRARFRINEGPWRVFNYAVLFQNAIEPTIMPYTVFNQKTDIVIEAMASTGTIAAGAWFTGILESFTAR